jgi:bifunctional non-homologous end joining protein LigD
MAKQKLEVDSHVIEVSNPKKILFPDVGLTKQDLIDHYRRMAEIMLPHLAGRPLTMQRFPNGIEEEGFFQKEAPDYFPDWIERVTFELREDDRVQSQIICNDVATLVYLANQSCITFHIWLSQKDKLEHPDKLIFDLDPPGENFELVRTTAKALRALLIEIGLVPFVMTTGSRGLHLVIPLDRSADFETVRDFAKDLADLMASRRPDDLTTATRKNEREERLFLDYLRNAYGQTSVAPYTVRAKPGAPIATPLDWTELDDPLLHSRRFNLENIAERVQQKGDPWRDMWQQARSLDEPRRHLDQLISGSGSR